MDRKYLKESGKILFKKNYWHSVLIAFLMLLGQGVSFSFSYTPSDTSAIEDFNVTVSNELFFSSPIIIALSAVAIMLTLLSIFVFSSLRCGGIRYFLKARKNQHVDLGEVIQNFKDKTFLNIAKITFFKNLFITLWMLLFIVPGIIKMFEYWAIDFILAVRPDIDRREAHRLSKILMDGNKADLFVLGLSFLGWNLLSLFTFGLLNIFYVSPYEQATNVEFFSEIRQQALAKGLITPYDVPDYEYITPEYQNPFAQGDYYQGGFAPQYNTSADTQQNSQYYGNFAQPNQQYNPQYNQQSFAQPQPPVAPEASAEATQNAENDFATNWEPVTEPEKQE